MPESARPHVVVVVGWKSFLQGLESGHCSHPIASASEHHGGNYLWASDIGVVRCKFMQ
jgi:hypothetical protein